ncbi:hypothetical protein LguiB_021503 [Lonicera macranthoides]
MVMLNMVRFRMLSGYWNWGNEVEAHRLFDMMPERNVITWNAVVTGYSKVDLESARRCLNQMPDKRVALWNVVLSGYAQNGFAEEAVQLFNDVMNALVQPDETTWVAVILSCSSRGDPCFAESLEFCHMECYDFTWTSDWLDTFPKAKCYMTQCHNGTNLKPHSSIKRNSNFISSFQLIPKPPSAMAMPKVQTWLLFFMAAEDLESLMGHALDLG